MASHDQVLQVIDACMKPKCHSADSETVQRVCTQHPFLRSQLQQICEQYFDWSPDKTDEYILPKIAERDLRRFANLCSTSSKLGVRIPLDKMPVPCPVSAIVKQRKVLGRDFFEVSWQEMQGLETSVVPADVVESACPEKIAEFIERKCERKKKQNNRRARPKKSAEAHMGEVDLQLKGLMLSLESQSSSPVDAMKHNEPNSLKNNIMKSDAFIDLSSPSPPLRACKLAKHRVNVDKHADAIGICESETTNKDKHVDVINVCESETTNKDKHVDVINVDVINVCESETTNKDKHVDVIDVCESHVDVIDVCESETTNKDKHVDVIDVCESETVSVDERVDVIDICESESDVSPEHEKKARELRLFISSIREDLY